MDSATPQIAAPPPGAPARRGLSRRDKAAVVVRLLLAEGLEVPLSGLSDRAQADLAAAMARLRYVDRDTLRETIGEFVTELEAVGLAFPDGLHGALDALGDTLSERAAAQLRRQAGLSASGDPWARIGAVDAARLVPILMAESVEVAAVILSKLKVARAAEALGLLPGDRARRVTYAVSQIGAVSPEVVSRIGESILAQLEAEAPGAFASAPVQRVGAILNSSPAATREAMLDALGQEDADFAEDVRRAIFTFANIAQRIDPRDVPKITRDVAAPDLVRALAAALAKGPDAPEALSAEFILSNMSQRMAAQLREDIAAAGRPRPAEAEAAMAGVVAAIRTLEESGAILLVAEDD